MESIVNRSRIKLILNRLADRIRPVRFVQIGSNDGVTNDPLHDLIVRDRWSGVLVEPAAEVFAQLKRNYERVPYTTCVRAAITTFNGYADFWKLREPSPGEIVSDCYNQIGSLHRRHLLSGGINIPGIAARITKERVLCMTFRQLMQKASFRERDLLHIDAEGEDDLILRDAVSLWDFFKQRLPAVILYEHKCLLIPERDDCQVLLKHHGYTLLREAGDTIAFQKEVLGL